MLTFKNSILSLSLLTLYSGNTNGIDFFKSNKTIVNESLVKLQALYNIGFTLEQINSLNNIVKNKENKLSLEGYNLKKNLIETLISEQEAEKKLIRELSDSTQLEIKYLQGQIALKNTKVVELTKALNSDLAILSYVKPLSYYGFGYLDKVKNFFEKADENLKSAASQELTKHQAEIEKLLDEIKNKEKIVKDITAGTTDPKLAEIKFDVMKLNTILKSADKTFREARVKDIFEVHNSDADLLLNNLKRYIVDAKCKSINSIADTKIPNMTSCAKENITKIRDKTKVASCKKIGDFNLKNITAELKLISTCMNDNK